MASSYLRIGNLLVANGKLKDAEDAYRHSEEVARTLVYQAPVPARFREVLCTGLTKLGLVYFKLDRLQDAETALVQSTSMLDELLASDSKNVSVPRFTRCQREPTGQGVIQDAPEG